VISLAINVALIYKEKIYSLLLLNLERWKIQDLLYLFQTKMNKLRITDRHHLIKFKIN
jgi:hypothetical protein